jgi:hypothetical protein
MSVLFLLRHRASRIILPPLLLLFYMWLSWRVFILMLGCAFAGDIVRWSLVLLFLGALGGFILSLLPSFIWPRSRFLWPFAYAATTLVFGLGSVRGLASSDGVWPFVVWSGCGLCILAAGLFGSFRGGRLAGHLRLTPNLA